MLVAISRMSTLTGRLPPTRSISRSWMARSSLACSRGSISLTSSSSSVPPVASSNLPTRRATAPVKAPFSWPNSSDSSRLSGIAAQLRATKGPRARRLRSCRKRATISLPVPLSPVTSTQASEGANCWARRSTWSMRGSSETSSRLLGLTVSRRAAISSGSGGSGRNSRAPALIAAAARRGSALMP